MLHSENRALSYGGAIYVDRRNIGYVDLCELVHNIAQVGGGVYSFGGAVTFSESQFDSNLAAYGGALGYNIADSPSTMFLQCEFVWVVAKTC